MEGGEDEEDDLGEGGGEEQVDGAQQAGTIAQAETAGVEQDDQEIGFT